MADKKWLNGLVLLATVTLVLAGCGRDGEGSTDDAAGDVSAVADGPATGKIVIWAMGTEGEVMPQIAEAFEAENPDAEVTVTAVPWDDAPTKISTAIASGQTPDVTLINPSALASYVATGGFSTVPDDVVDEGVFDETAVAATKVGGKAYSVPLYVDTRVLFYRKDIAQKAGVPAPRSWGEWAGFAKSLQDNGAKQGMLLPTGELGFTEQVLIPFIWEAGGAITDAGQTAFTLDTEQTAAGLAQYRSFFDAGVASKTGTYEPWGSVEERLASGEIGSVIQGPWLVPSLKKILGAEYDDKIGVATIPAGPSSGASWLDGGQLAVFRDAKNADGAWKFIRFISQTAQAARFSQLTGDLPAVTAAWEPAGLTTDPTTAVFSEQLKATGIPPTIATWTEVANVFAGFGERLARGTVTPQEAASGLQKELSGIGLR